MQTLNFTSKRNVARSLSRRRSLQPVRSPRSREERRPWWWPVPHHGKRFAGHIAELDAPNPAMIAVGWISSAGRSGSPFSRAVPIASTWRHRVSTAAFRLEAGAFVWPDMGLASNDLRPYRRNSHTFVEAQRDMYPHLSLSFCDAWAKAGHSTIMVWSVLKGDRLRALAAPPFGVQCKHAGSCWFLASLRSPCRSRRGRSNRSAELLNSGADSFFVGPFVAVLVSKISSSAHNADLPIEQPD